MASSGGGVLIAGLAGWALLVVAPATSLGQEAAARVGLSAKVDGKEVVVLRFEGASSQEAFSGKSRLGPKALNQAVEADAKDPLVGTVKLTSYRLIVPGNKKNGITGTGTLKLELGVTRQSKESKEWALTGEAAQSLKKAIPFSTGSTGSTSRPNGIR